jgi:multiple sugar transport system permease protein
MAIVGQTTASRSFRQTRLVMTGLLTLFLIYTLLPLYYLAVSATKSNADLFSTFGLWFGPNLNLVENIRELASFEGGIFGRWLWNSTWYAAVASTAAALMATAAGYALAKFDFPGRQAVFAIILGAIMVPTTALVIPIFLMLSGVGLVDTAWAVILPSTVFPLGVYIMRVYAEGAIPDELLDAARVDGAGELRIFVTVALRLVAPGFVTVLLLSFTAVWNNYFLPLVVLTTPERFTLTVGLSNWYQLASIGSGGQALFSLVLTGTLLGIVPVAVTFLALQRFWQGGLSAGSVK